MLAVAAEISAPDGIVPIDFLENHLIGVRTVKHHGSFRAEFDGCIEHSPRGVARQQHTLMSVAGLRLDDGAVASDEEEVAGNAIGDAASEFEAPPGDKNNLSA